MIVSLRIHIVFYGCLLGWGCFDLVRVLTGEASLVTGLLGVTYLVVAVYRLYAGPGSETPVPAVQPAR